ncbi:hypothetical protein [Pseudodesulfovibrio piezophilus]|uniref:Leucine carboxyl methyltransferase n=1 Tax=Pseudodesulfovibrio piezophilus (strain DSM 21447 / JCM 15486 / C1TLV30) TaxID=1322246 RepID=M1WLU5_PSEP2|nr:hypothetical protein [Pseudodesulfovibrio piezophilus]CCH48470.1 protein of unknown function [Pseudodesulfovibrio piezophilus C1TLV30]
MLDAGRFAGADVDKGGAEGVLSSCSWKQLYGLSSLEERRGWLTLLAKAQTGDWTGGKRREYLAESLMEQCGGQPGAFPVLHRMVAPSLVCRSMVLDSMLKKTLATWKGNEPVSVWNVGSGAEFRWPRIRTDLKRDVSWHECELPVIAELKRRLFKSAPVAEEFAVVQQHTVSSMCDFPAVLGDPDRNHVIIFDGVMDCLPVAQKSILLTAVRRACPRALLIFDALDEKGAAFDNRRPERFTGHPALRMYGLPGDIGEFFLQNGWALHEAVKIMDGVVKLACTRFHLPKVIGKLKLPAAVTAHYHCYRLLAASGLMSVNGAENRRNEWLFSTDQGEETR